MDWSYIKISLIDYLLLYGISERTLSQMKKYCLVLIGALVILITFLLVYRPTLFNFLIADDFLLMGWTYQAQSQPKMLLEQYYTTHPLVAAGFYRPILSTILWLGYKLWGTNGLYFRLLNMSFELLSGLMLGLVTVALNQESLKQRSSAQLQFSVWALFSAVLFVFYPLHSESVNWITVITNPLIALFSFFSLWSYIKWRNESKQQFLILSILSAIFAFLTKESAATLPATILIYELMFLKGSTKKSGATTSNRTPLQILYGCIIKTFPYWLILGFYFCLRKVVLGEFIAGYPDYMCPQSVMGWLHGLRDIFVPTNFMLISTHSFIFKAWHVVIFTLILLSVIATIRANINQRKVIYFLVIWFLLALAPNYKIFPSAMNTIVGSRLAYLSTAPLCIFLTYGLALYAVIPNRIVPAVRCFSVTAFALAAVILYINNLAWAEAGVWTSKVISELQSYYRKTTGDPLVYIVGLPTGSKNGVYCVGMLRWITLRPFFDRDLVNCVRLEDESYVSPMFVKKAVNSGARMALLYWDAQNETLRPVKVSAKNCRFTTNWRGSDLKRIIHVGSSSPTSKLIVHWLNDGTLELKSQGKKEVLAVLDITLPALPCWCVDFLAVKLQAISANQNLIPEAKLYFTNSLVDEYSTNANVCLGVSKPGNEAQELFFPLQNLSKWSMGGQCKTIRIVLPIGQDIIIKEISMPESRTLIPEINFRILPEDRPGQLRLGPQSPYLGNVQFDAHSINGAQKVELEATQVAIVQNGAVDPQNIRKSFFFRKRVSHPYGQLTLNKIEFPPESAIYKASLIAIDHAGNQVGFPSDTIFIRTDY